MNKEREDALTEIHRLALDNDHRLVHYISDELQMTKRVIANLEKKLMNIADLCQVAFE